MSSKIVTFVVEFDSLKHTVKPIFVNKLRGGVTKKSGKIWEKFPKGGGEKTDGNSQFQF